MSFILITFLGYFRIYRYPQTRTYQWCLQTWLYLSRILGLASERVQKRAHKASLGPDCQAQWADHQQLDLESSNSYFSRDMKNSPDTAVKYLT